MEKCIVAFVSRTELFSLSLFMSSTGAACADCAVGTAGVTRTADATDAASTAVSGLSSVTSSRSMSPPAGTSVAFSGRTRCVGIESTSRVYENETS